MDSDNSILMSELEHTQNDYTVYMNQLINDKPTGWKKYFEDVSYASGIKFLQSQSNTTNVAFRLRSNKIEDLNISLTISK